MADSGQNGLIHQVDRPKSREDIIQLIVRNCYSRSLVVNSLSLALTDLMKSEATIMGVKQMSQSYFLTKDLKASL